MSEITKVELYHKGINKNYATLYIKIYIEKADILSDDVSNLLKSYFIENKQPFEPDKYYEVILYSDYIIDDGIEEYNQPVKIENHLYNKAEAVRSVLQSVEINVDTICLFGNIVDKNPKIVIEIEEHKKTGESNTNVMVDQDIYERLINYYKTILIEFYLKNEPLTEKKKSKILKLLNEKYMVQPLASQNEVDRYLWAMRIVDFSKKNKLKYEVFDKKKNGFLSFTFDRSEFWVRTIFTKVHNVDKEKEVRMSFQNYFNERMNHFYNEFIKNAQNNYIVCDVLNIPFTLDSKIIATAFWDQYAELGSFSDTEAEKAYNELVVKTNDIINKANSVINSGNQLLLDKINNKELTISEAYSILISKEKE